MRFMAKPAQADTETDGWLVRSVFYGLLGLIAWVPFPLASNRPWSWSFPLVPRHLVAAGSDAAFLAPVRLGRRPVRRRRCLGICSNTVCNAGGSA